MTSVFATGADAHYGYLLLNLLGSLQANSPGVFDRVVVHDLGLDARQRRLLDRVAGVEVRTVPPFAPHWSRNFTWKPWIWTHLDAELVFWLDAGATLLRSLGPAMEQVRELGYFVVSQGNELRDIVPPDYAEEYGVGPEALGRPYVAAGIVGFRTGGRFWEEVVLPTYEDCLAGRNLGFSPHEAPYLNRGLSHSDDPPLRDCAHFRWDQTLFNLHLAAHMPDPVVADLDEYAGWRSPRDHPAQVIWSHRRTGDLAYLKRIRYAGRGGWRLRALGAREQLRWWLRLHDRYFRRDTYMLKARAILRSLRRG